MKHVEAHLDIQWIGVKFLQIRLSIITDLVVGFSSSMEPTTSLFARARPKVSLPKSQKKPGFFDLPGELRNRIYQYYFQGTYRCELIGASYDLLTATPTTIKLLSNNSAPKSHRRAREKVPEPNKQVVVRFPRRRRSTSAIQTPRLQDWLNSHGALILVCKQVHAETVPLLYRRITFVFEAPRRIAGFLSKIPQHNHSHVTSMHLHYSTYGSPEAASHVVWQQKHLESWTRACKAAAKSLTCLRELEVFVWINEDAPKFNLRQKWLQPLWQFRRLACGDHAHRGSTGGMPIPEKTHTLTTVKVRVKSRAWPRRLSMVGQLADACKHLHRLYGHGISKAILGAKEEEAMAAFKQAWNERYYIWQHHLGFANTGW